MNEKKIVRARHDYVWKKGNDGKNVLWVYPRLAFLPEQWDIVLKAMDAVRVYSQDNAISDSKCIEFMAAEFLN